LLKQKYEEKGKANEFQDEQAIHSALLPKLLEKLSPTYLVKPLGLGSTATVWVLFDPGLPAERALKLPRPRLSKLKNIVRIVRAERERLGALNHQNIIRIYGADEVRLDYAGEQHSFPYFIMELLQDVLDLEEFVVAKHRQLQGTDLIVWFRDILSGLSYLASQGIIHCDIKPGNILLAPRRPALIADLGYAKHWPRPSSNAAKGFTEVAFTPDFAHPELRQHVKESSDSNANVAELSRDKLSPRFDLFALGRTMQRVLAALRDAERKDPEKEYGHRSILSSYQWVYLGYIAKRLLDGVVERQTPDDLLSDVIPRLPQHAMTEIRYSSADEALEDFDKFLNLYDLEGQVPELNPNLSSYLQIPSCRVPLTPRVGALIEHPTFARLVHTTQLGFVSLIYPGANHTRFEHVLGTFTHCCAYSRALWYDQANCLFQCIMSKKDVEAGLLAALLHDIAQYPMAHDLSEIDSSFAHERFTRQVLERVPQSSDYSLAMIVQSEWDIDIDEVCRILNANRKSSLRHQLLKSLISGPLDCDKLDYLKRDAIHLGVSFGLSIDEERLLRNLTVAYGSTTTYETSTDGTQKPVQKLSYAEIGVTEKALVVAEMLWKARKEMFTQVYWQHTARALKAMLGHVVRRILIRIRREKTEQQFWESFSEYLLDPIGFFIGRSGFVVPATDVAHSSAEWRPTQLSASDDSVLAFLWRYCQPGERRLLQAVRSRRLYRRLAVFSQSGASRTNQSNLYEEVYDQFRAYRLGGDNERIEQVRSTWESKIIQVIGHQLRDDPARIPAGHTAEDIVQTLTQLDPFILVDIPVKAISTAEPDEQKALRYLAEDVVGVHSRKLPAALDFSFSGVSLDDKEFDKEVGKIRVLAHPDWRDLAALCIHEDAVLNILCGRFA